LEASLNILGYIKPVRDTRKPLLPLRRASEPETSIKKYKRQGIPRVYDPTVRLFWPPKTPFLPIFFWQARAPTPRSAIIA
jgi:hypothetical protein